MSKDKLFIESLREIEDTDVPSMTPEEFKKCDFNKGIDFRQFHITLARDFDKINEWPEELRKEFETKFGDYQEKMDKLYQEQKKTVIARGQTLVVTGDPVQRLEGAMALVGEPLARWLSTYAKGEFKKMPEIAQEINDILKNAGVEGMLLGRGMVAPAEFRQLSTTALSGGEFIPDILIPAIIDYSHEEFPMLSKFKTFRVKGDGTIPRLDSGLTMSSRSEGSVGTFTTPVTGELSFASNIFSTNALVNKELISVSAIGQIQQLVIRFIGRSVSNWWKDMFINGTGTLQPQGLETDHTSGSLYTETYTDGKLIETIMRAAGKLGGDENDLWEDRAYIIGKKSMRNGVLEEQYSAGTAFKIPLDKAMGDFSIRGVPWSSVSKVPAGIMYIVVPEEYYRFEIVGDTFMVIEDSGYTLRTTNRLLFMYNHKVDSKLSGNGLAAGNEDRFAAVRISAEA